mmetsp:Transcript_22855/g.40467  ORF Transcript_22855/g.40467 Transcript_22855/m.40467 type:complete len:239 (+) Transcript_22855:642-1358(+)
MDFFLVFFLCFGGCSLLLSTCLFARRRRRLLSAVLDEKLPQRHSLFVGEESTNYGLLHVGRLEQQHSRILQLRFFKTFSLRDLVQEFGSGPDVPSLGPFDIIQEIFARIILSLILLHQDFAVVCQRKPHILIRYVQPTLFSLLSLYTFADFDSLPLNSSLPLHLRSEPEPRLHFTYIYLSLDDDRQSQSGGGEGDVVGGAGGGGGVGGFGDRALVNGVEFFDAFLNNSDRVRICFLVS